MCARYDIHHDEASLIDALRKLALSVGTQSDIEDAKTTGVGGDLPLQPNYNAAPTNVLPVVVNHNGSWQFELMELGLIPAWTIDIEECVRPVNARDDSLLIKPYFQRAIVHGRCLVPMSGYYEWQKAGKRGKDRLPFYIYRKDEQPFYVAGLFDEWKSPHGPIRTFCTVTVLANEFVSYVQPRMLAMLSPEDAKKWMDPDTLARDAVALLKPYAGNDLTMHRVTIRVNKVDFNEQACIRKITDEEAAIMPQYVRAVENQRKQDKTTGQQSLFNDDF